MTAVQTRPCKTAVHNNAYADRWAAIRLELTAIAEFTNAAAQSQQPMLSHPARNDKFPIRLPASLTLTPVFASSANTDGAAPEIDAVFSRKVEVEMGSAEGAHVMLAGDTLYLHGCRLPARATAVLETCSHPVPPGLELDAYGWSTMKSVKLPATLREGGYCLRLVGRDGAIHSNTVFLTVCPVYSPCM